MLSLITQRFYDAKSLASRIHSFINMDDKVAMDHAFGAAYEEGDPERLAQLAKRWNGFYESFLDWAASLRDINAPSELHTLLELAARFADEPLEKYRLFVDEYVVQVDEFPALIATGKADQLSIRGSIILSGPDGVINDYEAELSRLRSRLQL